MWEYRKIDLCEMPIKVQDVDVLNTAGHEGWELVMITLNNMAYMKRYIAPPKPVRRKET